MPKKSEIRIEIDWVPQTWYGRLIAAVAGVMLLWFGIVFFAVFMIIIGLVSAFAIALMVLALIKTAKRQPSSFIDAEYHVEKSDIKEHQNNKKNEVDSKRK